jgi:hypothetical protein
MSVVSITSRIRCADGRDPVCALDKLKPALALVKARNERDRDQKPDEADNIRPKPDRVLIAARDEQHQQHADQRREEDPR